MIYTVTLNPSIDYVVEVNELTAGEIMRTKAEDLIFGGKGNQCIQYAGTAWDESPVHWALSQLYRDALEQGACGHGHSAGFS